MMRTILVIISAVILGFSTVGLSKDLPISVSPLELSGNEQLSGSMVTLTVTIQDVYINTGTRGGNYIELRVIDNPVLKLFMEWTAGKNIEYPGVGRKITAEGQYYAHSRYGGMPYDDFVIIKSIYYEREEK